MSGTGSTLISRITLMVIGTMSSMEVTLSNQALMNAVNSLQEGGGGGGGTAVEKVL